MSMLCAVAHSVILPSSANGRMHICTNMKGQACCLACRLRKDKTKADVLWLKPKQKVGMWSSKWVPFEVEVFTPKKSRVDKIPWRSEFLDTGCFVVS